MHTTPSNNSIPTRSVLGTLRSLVPSRSLTSDEALRIAELQANRLLALTGITDGPIPNDLLTFQPRLRIVLADLPVSGTSHWSGQEWIIALNRSDAPVRQRLTLLHEYKHIVDHGRTHWLYRDTPRRSAQQQAEQAADYFAGCVLVPRRLLKRAWGDGMQRPAALAEHFEVSVPAIEVRLAQTGLVETHRRCGTPSTTGTYFRSFPTTPLILTPSRSAT